MQSGDESPSFLSTLPAHHGERRLALAATGISLLVFVALAPFAGVRLAAVPAFYPIYQSALVVCDLITAILLFGQFAIVRSRALLILAAGYVFSAFMAAAHALSFPGLFSATGLLGAGPQTTAWLYFLWHLGFPAAVIAYALLRNGAAAAPRPAAARSIGAAVAAAAGAAAALTALATAGHDALPVIMRADEDLPAKYAVAWATWLLTLAALPAIWRRGRRVCVLDLWLMVVLCAWICDVALAAVFNAGRYSLGWYAGRAYGLLAASFVLAVLLLENSGLYVRLAQTHARERGERRRAEDKTAELNALNASLEERIGQRTAELERSNRELRSSREDLHELAAVGAAAREQEKSRLARELHDELGQSLTALNMDLNWLAARAGGDRDATARLEGMREVVANMVAETRRIAADLRPLMLDDLGLVPSARWLADNFRRHHPIECELRIVPPEFELPDAQSTAVFRIMQETLTNVAKHAGASRVELTLSRADGEVRLRVRDNGRGFDPAAPRRASSFGLIGLRERAYFVSGSVGIDSAPGRGTTVEVSIPLPEAEGA